jgi:hypothetical protein
VGDIINAGFKEVSMAIAFRRLAVMIVLLGLAVGPVFSQAAPPSDGFKFSMNLGLGVQTFNDKDTSAPIVPPATTYPPTTTYQYLSLTPDFAFGKFGIGLDITLNYRFAGGGSSFQVRQADWVPTSFPNFLEIYLPKIAYVRWGVKGDPLFLKLGSFIDATLGDGFIMGSYANTLFLPGNRHFGLQADLDGSLFAFPYVGVETVFGNVAVLDVMGGRAYVRPFAGTSIPIVNNLQVGLTGVVDTQPYFGMDKSKPEFAGSPPPVSEFGADVMVPLVYQKDVISLVAFTDLATLQAKSWGYMIGAGGRIINIFTYGAQLRLLGAGFTPDYFGPTYDLLRGYQYNLLGGSGWTFGWLASIGTSLLNDLLIFNIAMDGPFVTAESDPLLSSPHLRGILTLGEGLVPGISFNFSYDKKGITKIEDLVSAKDAAIQALVNFRTGPAVISLVYKIIYDPTQSPNPWNVTSGLQSSISLF